MLTDSLSVQRLSDVILNGIQKARILFLHLPGVCSSFKPVSTRLIPLAAFQHKQLPMLNLHEISCSLGLFEELPPSKLDINHLFRPSFDASLPFKYKRFIEIR